jgi:hypothetical protein
VLAPDPTERLQRAHFEPGDEVIRQGDEGESGRLEVLKDGSKLGELGEGDCFGEIALLSKVRRTARLSMMLSGTFEVWAPVASTGSTEDVVSNAVVSTCPRKPPRKVWLSLIRQLASA